MQSPFKIETLNIWLGDTLNPILISFYAFYGGYTVFFVTRLQCPLNPRPVHESILEFKDNSWIIGDEILLSLHQLPSSGSTWSDGKNSFYNISPHTHYRHVDHCQPRATSRRYMMPAGYQQSGESATRFVK